MIGEKLAPKYCFLASVIWIVTTFLPSDAISAEIPLSFDIEINDAEVCNEDGVNTVAMPAAAQAALFHGVSILESMGLFSDVPVKTVVCWVPISGGAIGGASSAYVDYHLRLNNSQARSDYLPRDNVLYSAPLANSLAGRDLLDGAGLPIDHHLRVRFNSNTNWYTGLDKAVGPNQQDLVTAVLHEFIHGLGFDSGSDVNGNRGLRGETPVGFFLSSYDMFLQDGNGNRLADGSVFPNDSIALGAVLTGNDVFYSSSRVRALNNGLPVKIYAPAVWSGGASISHVDSALGRGSLMWHTSELGDAIHDPGPFVIAVLKDIGWSAPPGKPTLWAPNSQISVDANEAFSFIFERAPGSVKTYQLNYYDKTIQDWIYKNYLEDDICTGQICVIPHQGLGEQSNVLWRVRGLNSAGAGRYSYNSYFDVARTQAPGLPVLRSPIGGASAPANTGIEFIFKRESIAARTYQLNVFDGTKVEPSYDNYSADEICEEDICQIFHEGLDAQQNASWRVRGLNSAGEGPWTSLAYFNVANTSLPGVPVLQSPIGGASVSANTDIEFRFKRTSTAASIYQLNVFDRTTGVPTYVNYSAASICENDICRITHQGLNVQPNAAWRIRGLSNIGEGDWTRLAYFNVANTSLPGVPVLQSPIGGASVSANTNIEFRFKRASTAASTYQLNVFDRTAANPSYVNYSAATICENDICSISHQGLNVQRNAAWRVRGLNNIGNGDWTSLAYFQVEANAFRQVFLTSSRHFPDFGGLTQADAVCQNLANDNPATVRAGKYVAWMSDGKTNASERIDHAAVPYRKTNGVDIASNYNDLTDGTLLATFDTDERGVTVFSGSVWTGTTETGTSSSVTTSSSSGAGANSCQNWTSRQPGSTAVIGSRVWTNYRWTGASVNGGSAALTCSVTARLYCIQTVD